MAAKKGGLGRGLDSLFNDNANENVGAVTVRLNDIEPNRDQPRKDFDETALGELADSIAKHGLLQPVIVHPTTDGTYQIIAGERRWRACRIAGLTEIPVIVKELDEKSLAEIALIENLQREDLNAVEEAVGFRSLIDRFGLTQEQVAEQMGKSRSAVTNALRLLNLNEPELEALRTGVISAGHARALLSSEDENERQRMLLAAVNGASVRELEKMAADGRKTAARKEKKATVKRSFYSEVELSLKNELHRKITVTPGARGGILSIEFYDDEELKEFAVKLIGED